jgi:SLOG cluster2
MTPLQRSLVGLRVGISISETAEMPARGFSAAGMERLTLTFTQALLGEGARLAFGHDWRQHGVMESLCSYAVDELPRSGEASDPALLNLIPWPSQTTLSPGLLARLEGALEVRQAGLPEELQPRAGRTIGPEDRAYLTSRGLSHLRHELTRVCGARIGIGGRTAGFSGRYPGVIEEALFALGARQPLYLVGLLGGSSEAVGRAILDRQDLPEGYDVGPERPISAGLRSLRRIYLDEAGGAEIPDPLDDRACDLSAAWRWLQRFGAEQLSSLNGLSQDENRRLLITRVEEEALALVLQGLRRIGSRRAGSSG